MSWKILDSHLTFIYPFFQEKISDINMSRVDREWFSPILLHENGTFIWSKNDIVLDLTFMFFQEHHQPQIILNVLNCPYQFRLYWGLDIDLLFWWFSMDDPISYSYDPTGMSPCVIVHIIQRSNTGEQFGKIPWSNYTLVFYCIIYPS